MGGAQIRVERFKYRNLSQVVCTLPPPINRGAALSGGGNRLANNIGNAGFQSSMSTVGTFETCQPALKLSAYRGRPEVTGGQSERRD